MKTGISSVISLLLAIVLVFGTLFTSCSDEEKESQATKYLNKILEATFAGVETVEPQVTTSKVTLNNVADLGLPNVINAQSTLITGISGESVSFTEVTFDSGKVDLSVYNSGNACIIESSAIGAAKYGFELNDIGTLLGYFVPAQPAPSPVYDDAEIPQEGATVNVILGMLMGAESFIEGIDPEKMNSLFEKYAEIIVDAAENTCESKVETGENIKVTVEFNTDSAKKLIKDVFSALKKDKELKDIIESLLVASGMPSEEAEAQISAIFSDETVKGIYDTLEASPFVLKVEVNANNEFILNAASVELESQGTTMEVFFDAAEEGKVKIGVSSTATVNGVTDKQESYIVFEKKDENGVKTLDASLVTKLNSAAHVQSLFRAKLEGEKYAVTVYVPDEEAGMYEVTVKGNTKTEGNKTTTTVDTIDSFGNIMNLDLKIETEIGGTLPEFPTDFKNILDVTGDEFNVILNNLKNSPLGQFIPEEEPEIELPEVEY